MWNTCKWLVPEGGLDYGGLNIAASSLTFAHNALGLDHKLAGTEDSHRDNFVV